MFFSLIKGEEKMIYFFFLNKDGFFHIEKKMKKIITHTRIYIVK